MFENQITKAVYRLLGTLPKYNYLTNSRSLPPNGIYIFYEEGETCWLDGKEVSRIVRIGTHNHRIGRPGVQGDD